MDLSTEEKRRDAIEAWVRSLEAEREGRPGTVPQDGMPTPPSGTMPTVSHCVDSYIDELEASQAVKPSAVSDYRTSARRIAEGIGDVPVGELTPSMIQAWEDGLLEGGRGANTVLKYHSLLSSAYRHAVEKGDAHGDPCSSVTMSSKADTPPNILDPQQYAHLSKTLCAMAPTPTVTTATLALLTGMRLGEVCGLKWGRYDRDAGTISVEKAIASAGGKPYETEPKSDSARRLVPVDRELADMLRRRRERMESELRESGASPEEAGFGDLYVVGHIDGRPPLPQRPQSFVEGACRVAGDCRIPRQKVDLRRDPEQLCGEGIDGE